MPLIPYVIEQSARGERGFDIFSRLLRDRIIFLGSEVNDEVGEIIVADLSTETVQELVAPDLVGVRQLISRDR